MYALSTLLAAVFHEAASCIGVGAGRAHAVTLFNGAACDETGHHQSDAAAHADRPRGSPGERLADVGRDAWSDESRSVRVGRTYATTCTWAGEGQPPQQLQSFGAFEH